MIDPACWVGVVGSQGCRGIRTAQSCSCLDAQSSGESGETSIFKVQVIGRKWRSQSMEDWMCLKNKSGQNEVRRLEDLRVCISEGERLAYKVYVDWV